MRPPDAVVACAERAAKRTLKKAVKAAKVTFSKRLDSWVSGVRAANDPAADDNDVDDNDDEDADVEGADAHGVDAWMRGYHGDGGGAGGSGGAGIVA